MIRPNPHGLRLIVVVAHALEAGSAQAVARGDPPLPYAGSSVAPWGHI